MPSISSAWDQLGSKRRKKAKNRAVTPDAVSGLLDGRRWQGLETLEPRLLMTGVLDNLSEVFVTREVLHGLPGDTQMYDFEFGFGLGGPDALSSARFQVPGGQWFDITINEGNEWFYENETATESDLDAFSDGNPFGVAATEIKKMSRQEGTTKYQWPSNWPDPEDDLDFVVRVV